MRRPKPLDREQRFSELLGLLSTCLVTISDIEFDRHIDGWLGAIAECLGWDRMVLAEYPAGKEDFSQAAGIPQRHSAKASAAL